MEFLQLCFITIVCDLNGELPLSIGLVIFVYSFVLPLQFTRFVSHSHRREPHPDVLNKSAVELRVHWFFVFRAGETLGLETAEPVEQVLTVVLDCTFTLVKQRLLLIN